MFLGERMGGWLVWRFSGFGLEVSAWGGWGEEMRRWREFRDGERERGGDRQSER